MPAWTSAPQGTLDRLREAFAAAEYNSERLTAAGIGPRHDETWRLRAAAPDGALSTLVRLWMVGAAIERAEAAVALAPATLDELGTAGLLEDADGDRVRATVVIKPYRDLLISSDRPSPEADEPRDFVPGTNPVASLLAGHTVRVPVGSALDLATGNGIQMVAAARHADDVLGTDVNPRALAFAQLTAGLNGTANVRLAEGSWFEPVGDETFDLIVANIPFVISPESSLLYRDSGEAPGARSAEVLSGAASRLNPGGFAHVMCEWGIASGQEWSEVPRRWLADTGCDAVILAHDHMDTVVHSVAWNHRLLGVAPDRFEEAVERWTAHHRAHGFESVGAATIVLRRRTNGGAPWVAALQLVRDPVGDAGEHVLRICAGEDLARSLGDAPEALLALPLSLVPGVRVTQVLTRPDERWRQRRAKLSVRPGLGVDALVAPRALDLVFALDGRPAEEVIRDVAARRNADEAELRGLAAETLPELVRRGFVTSGR